MKIGTDERIIVLAPRGRDAELMCRLFDDDGLLCVPCQDDGELSDQIRQGAGVVILTIEALTPAVMSKLMDLMEAQPPWSDLPIVLLGANGKNKGVVDSLGPSLTVLERPTHPLTLLTLVRSALASRRRQYRIRDLLQEQSRLNRDLEQKSLDLERVNEVLRKEAEERSRAEEELQKYMKKLEQSNRDLQDFAFIASHDLREPLRKVQVLGSLLEARGADHLSDQERGYVSRMTGAANRMQEILDALLKYSQVDTKGQEFRPVKLDDVVRGATDDLEMAIRDCEAHVEIDPLPTVEGDPHQLRQLLQNLVSNALKYHRSGVKPVIKIHGETENGTGRIFVEDNGIGFDEKYLDKIFQPFQRLHGRNEYPGTGMGLAICRKVVERHGGTITARSTPGKGSTFIITLPVVGVKAMNKPG